MDQQEDAGAEPRQGRGRGIDQERHIVRRDLDERVGTGPIRIVDADIGLAGAARLGRVEIGQCDRRQFARRAVRQVLCRHVGVEGVHEGIDEFFRPLARPPAGFGRHIAQTRGFTRFDRVHERVSPELIFGWFSDRVLWPLCPRCARP
jgi:hypothetical protein